MSLVEKSIIKNNVQTILSSVFNNSTKRQIKDVGDRLNFACPYCHDSKLHTFKKRGNLYLDNGLYKCFNCGISKSYKHFISDFGNDTIQLDTNIQFEPILRQSEELEQNNLILSDFQIREDEAISVLGFEKYSKRCYEYIEERSLPYHSIDFIASCYKDIIGNL